MDEYDEVTTIVLNYSICYWQSLSVREPLVITMVLEKSDGIHPENADAALKFLERLGKVFEKEKDKKKKREETR